MINGLMILMDRFFVEGGKIVRPLIGNAIFPIKIHEIVVVNDLANVCDFL
jgi:hypothetical protein